MSVVDSSQYRPETDGSGFRNLYLTVDWIKTALNVGSVEATVMAGMQTAREGFHGAPMKANSFSRRKTLLFPVQHAPCRRSVVGNILAACFDNTGEAPDPTMIV